MDETARRSRAHHRTLKGTAGDAINAILSAAAMNFQKLQGFSWRFLLRLLDQFQFAIAYHPIPSTA
jgi:hypothetical protein